MSAIENIIVNKKTYPVAISVSMIVAALVLSCVDLAFLNDVIGKILDLSSTASMSVSFVLGLIGMAFMAHQGVRLAHGEDNKLLAIGHYLIWLALGLLFAILRLFSATIMNLDNSLGDVSLIHLLGLNIREVDLVMAPLMFVMYVATGMMVMDGVKNLLSNPEFDNWLAAWKEARIAKKTEDSERRSKAEKRLAKLRDEAERKQRQREKEIEEARKKNKEQAEAGRIKNALNGSYSNALAQYRAKESEIKTTYQKISSNLDFIRGIDKQEKEFEVKVKPSLLNIIHNSIFSTQNSVALAIRRKTQTDIQSLRDTIEVYNTRHHKQAVAISRPQNGVVPTSPSRLTDDDTKIRSGRLVQ